MNFNSETLVALLRTLSNSRIRYEIGRGVGKVVPLALTEPHCITALDCSGYVQYVVYRASIGNVRMPQGSSRQENWCIENGCQRLSYSNDAPKMDDVVRIAFRARTSSMVRHVWLVINGHTYESTTRGGGNGPSSFHWFEREDQADSIYELGPSPSFLLQQVLKAV